MRIPGRQLGASLDRLAFVDRLQHGAVRHLVTFALATIVVVISTSPEREMTTFRPWRW